MTKTTKQIAEGFASLNAKIGKLLGENEASEGAPNPDEERGEFVAYLLASGVCAHLSHLQTRSYATHMALGAYYEAIPGLVDAVVEEWQGRMDTRIAVYPRAVSIAMPDPKQYFIELRDWVAQYRMAFGPSSEIQNRIDEIASLIDETLYRLSLV